MTGSVKLNSAGGGSVTLVTPSTASNLTLTLPSASGTVATTSGSGAVFTNPTINGFTGDTSAITVGTNQFVKDTSGNIGIGTSSPNTTYGPLTVLMPSTSNNGGVVIRAQTTSGNGSLPGLGFLNTSGTYIAGLTSDSSASGSNLRFLTNGTTEAMRLDSSGNLGLGVTPSAWSGFKALQINYGGFASYLNGSNIQTAVLSNTYFDGSAYKFIASTQATYYNQNNGSHQWYNSNNTSGTAGATFTPTQAMTLDASGNLFIGCTSAPTSANPGFQYGPNGALVLARTTTSTVAAIYFINGNGTVGQINTGGTSTTYVTTSDQRLKTNITPAGSAIQSILDFPVDQFDWISTGEHQDFGGVAQKIIPIIPEMVSVPEDPEEMMGVDWSKAVPRLIKAFQELTQRLEKLENQNGK